MNASRRAPFQPGYVLGALVLLLSVAPTVVAAPAIRILRGANQQATYASSFPAPLVVWVTDPATERPVPGLRVHFTPSAGIGLSASDVITDERGLATVTASGLFACTSRVAAELSGFPGTQVSFDGLEVQKAVLTVVPADLNSTVGGPLPTPVSYTIRGFVNGDTEAAAQITGSPILTTTATDRSSHANYAIKGGVGTLSAPNYTFVPGFGTLAMVGGSEAARGEQEASLGLTPEPVAVRAALTNQPSAVAVAQPAFLAGLRGESGVFVVAAIWQSIPAATPIKLKASTRAVLPSTTADLRKTSGAPVQPVVLPRLVATVASGQPSSTRSALLPAASSAAQSSYALPTIRKAFNPPGTK